MDKKMLTNIVLETDNIEKKHTEKDSFPESYYKNRTQKDLINKLFTGETFLKDKRIISILKKKISSYKQQDKHKKILRKESSIITLQETLDKLVASKLKCYYCKTKIFILYKQIREKKQWTLDRIDNSIGHHRDNVVISCLECNLKRRTTEIDRFTFTKQLKIKKLQETISDSDINNTDICNSVTNKQTEKENEKDQQSDIKIIKSEFL